MSLGILFLFFVIILIIGVPISASLAMSSFFPYLFDFFETWDFATLTNNAQMIVRSLFGGVDSYPLLAIPMFILSGVLMAKGGVSEKLFNVFSYFLSNKTGGMPCAVVITCLFYGAISGSGPATTAAVGAMTIPMLVGLGYELKFATALVAVAGGLGVIIPPSIPFILYGTATGASIGDMFISGVIPGLLIGGCLMAYAYIYCKRRGEDKEKLRAHQAELKEKGFWNVFKDSFWALLSPVIILGSIYGGIASPTEAAVISVVYGLVVSLVIYRSLKLRDLKKIFIEAVDTYTGLIFILAAAVAFGRTLTLMRAPQMVAEFMMTTFSSRVAVLLVINVFLLFVGMIMDTSPAILILAPILLPIAQRLGVHEIHFGIMMVVNLAVGFVTPPMGVNLFVASSMTGISVMDIAKKAMPLIGVFLIALLLITFIPALSTVLIS